VSQTGGGEGDGSDGVGSEADSDDDGVRPPVSELAAIEAQLLNKSSSDLNELVDLARFFAKSQGFPPVHKNMERDDSAYYNCSCKTSSCFAIKFSRMKPVAGQRKAASLWVVSKATPHLCEPMEPLATALHYSYIPSAIRDIMFRDFDLSHTARKAHENGCKMASEMGLATTWAETDVQNVFQLLQRQYVDESVIELLQNPAGNGHYVALDLAAQPNGNRLLDRLSLSTLDMQQLFRGWGEFVSSDFTYGKNNLQMPVGFVVGRGCEGQILPFHLFFCRRGF
jgi:hypothetical protein